jgi:carbonic anhydrase
MCVVCDVNLGRRGFLGLAGAGLAASLLPTSAFAAGGPTTSLTADQALAKLKEGNAKYVSSPQLCEADLANAREHVAKGQAPWATIISCADSRVPPELLFGGQGVGELFVGRNAGNMVDTATMGTIEYGSGVLGVPLIVVLGHQSCGAVAAACEAVTKGAKYPGSIGPMVKEIIPAVKAVKNMPGDLVDNAVRESAKRTALKIASKSPIISGLVKEGKVKVVAARYDLEKGSVEFLG